MVWRNILEIKVKRGDVGTKKTYSIIDFLFTQSTSGKELKEYILRGDLPISLKEQLNECKITLLNSYTRNYYESLDRNFRLTLDTKIMNYSVKNHSVQHKNYKPITSYCILELKYNTNYNMYSNAITNAFPFRITRCSKYVRGVKEIG